MNENPIAQGHYAKKQIYLKDWLISWSHRSRYETGLRLIRKLRPRRILDYGCGDGTLLALAAATPGAFEECLGCEPHSKDVEDCKRRLGSIGSLRFCTVEETEDPVHTRRYDLIVCMEVLEHVVDTDTVIERLNRLLSDDGRLVISVPVEIGLSVVVKQAARRIAEWRGLGDYRGTSRYRWSELAASLVAGPTQHISRPIYRDPDGTVHHDHKGFNWKVLHQKLGRRFETEPVLCSPVSWLPPAIASQVWFILRRTAQGGIQLRPGMPHP